MTGQTTAGENVVGDLAVIRRFAELEIPTLSAAEIAYLDQAGARLGAALTLDELLQVWGEAPEVAYRIPLDKLDAAALKMVRFVQLATAMAIVAKATTAPGRLSVA